MGVLTLFLVAAMVASVSCMDCGLLTSTTWWESAVVYQIYPRSFMDSNGDGIGDLNGITQKLPHLKETGIDAIWMSPMFLSPMYDFGYDIADYRKIAPEYGTMDDFDALMTTAKKLGITQKLPHLKETGIDAIWMSPMFLSPMYDFGYDIADYRKIAPEYGTMDDFDALMTTAKKLGIRVMLDYVPNHTSNESEWFVKSAQRDPKYSDYYIWADGRPDPKNPDYMEPPSNWISHFRKSAWEYNTVRGQYYLHQFVIGQPDLNYRSEKVREEMKDVLRFWLEKGVSGFRVDAVNMLYEVDPDNFNGQYPDEPLSGVSGKTPDDYEYLTHNYTRDQKETYDVIYDWRAVLDEFTEKHNESKLMITEAYTELPLMMQYYGNETRNGSVPFNFMYLGELSNKSTARDIKLNIDKWMTYMPTGKVANWVNGNHDQSRLASRYGVDRVDAMNMLALILPGITITYQGEELGMTDGHVSWKDTKDPQACNTDDPINYWKSSRDPARTPFHWDATKNAGFSTGASTWLPIADNYASVNLAAQIAANKSHYKFYKDVAALKRLPAVRSGDLDVRALCDFVLVVARLLPGHPAVVGVMNLSDKEIAVDLSSMRLLPQQLQVEASGINCSLDKGVKVQKDSITMAGHCALVLTASTATKKCCQSTNK